MVAERHEGTKERAERRRGLRLAAKRFGTPVYVIDMDAVNRAAADLERVFAGWTLQYSLKANDLPAVVSALAARGWGANVVSTGEWSYARSAGVTNDLVTFEGIGKTDAHLEYAVAQAAAGQPPRWLAVESAQEVGRLLEFADRYRLGHDGRPPIDMLIRLNPQVRPETRDEFAVGTRTSKFGMDRDEALSVAAVTSGSGVRLRGVHVHVGSDLHDVIAWAEAGERAVRMLTELSPYADKVDTVDFGGGFPLAGAGPSPSSFLRALLTALRDGGLSLPGRPAIEPGRYLVGGAGWLVSRVLHARARRPVAQQVVLDAGMTELIRPALYGSRHPVHALSFNGSASGGPVNAGVLYPSLLDTAVEGSVCESTDTFGIHSLPRMDRGDLVVIESAGAYAASFTSRYNGRPQPAEVALCPDGSLQLCERPGITDAQRRTADLRVAPVSAATV